MPTDLPSQRDSLTRTRTSTVGHVGFACQAVVLARVDDGYYGNCGIDFAPVRVRRRHMGLWETFPD